MAWIKLHTKMLRGGFHLDFNMAEHGIWVCLLLLSKESQYPGYLQKTPREGLPLDYIASQLRIKEKLLSDTLEKFKEEEMISFQSSGVIKFLNWDKFQKRESSKSAAELEDPDRVPFAEPITRQEPVKRVEREYIEPGPGHWGKLPDVPRWNQLVEKKKYVDLYGPMTEEETAELAVLQVEREASGKAIREKAEANNPKLAALIMKDKK